MNDVKSYLLTRHLFRFSQRKSTPENVIFFSEYVPAKDVDNTSKKSNHKIRPRDPKLIKSFIENYKRIGKNEFKNNFGNILEGSNLIHIFLYKNLYKKIEEI